MTASKAVLSTCTFNSGVRSPPVWRSSTPIQYVKFGGGPPFAVVWREHGRLSLPAPGKTKGKRVALPQAGS